MGIVTMKELLEAGVHFGHQTRRWDPRMKPYIFTERNGIHIIDLQRTIAQLKIAYNAIKESVKQGGIVLFVGTKRQAQQAVVEEATRCGMPYVANRWLGGMITNFKTIKNNINRLKRIERMEVDGSLDYMTKKEALNLKREKEKLLNNIGGVKDMDVLPDMIFIIDPKKEAIAVAEAMRAKIPIVAIVDTNCNPIGIDYSIPGNDDAIRAINLFSSIVSSAVIEGQNEAGRFEITEETKIMSLAEEEKKAEAVETEEIDTEGYLSDEEVSSDIDEKMKTEAETVEAPFKSSAEQEAKPEEELERTEEEVTKEEVTVEEGTKEEVTKEEGTKEEVTVEEGTKEEVTKEEVTKEEVTVEEGTEEEVTKEEGAEEKGTKVEKPAVESTEE